MNDLILDLEKLVYDVKKNNKKIGLGIISFDVINVECIRFFRYMKQKIDFLIIGIKPEKDFVISIEDKIKILENFETVDFVFEIKTNINDILKKINPDLFKEFKTTFNIYNRIIEKKLKE
ncbi:MAG: hypothetical protein LBF97_04150 [Elusimicrobiota bacterium]|jgi:hypothetical protein|nr:hypothetical protein [Elusimicrobiota bacterium]